MVFVEKYTKLDVQKVGLSLAWRETGRNISPKITFYSRSNSINGRVQRGNNRGFLNKLAIDA